MSKDKKSTRNPTTFSNSRRMFWISAVASFNQVTTVLLLTSSCQTTYQAQCASLIKSAKKSQRQKLSTM